MFPPFFFFLFEVFLTFMFVIASGRFNPTLTLGVVEENVQELRTRQDHTAVQERDGRYCKESQHGAKSIDWVQG
jgi:hypothetical protein